jgi:hypothetical protein
VAIDGFYAYLLPVAGLFDLISGDGCLGYEVADLFAGSRDTVQHHYQVMVHPLFTFLPQRPGEKTLWPRPDSHSAHAPTTTPTTLSLSSFYLERGL